MYRKTFVVLAVFVSAPLFAQQITLDWGSNDRSLSCPAETGRQSSIPVVITRLNDVLYSYTVETSTQYATTDDFSQLPKFSEAAQQGCPTSLHDAGAAYTVVAQKMQQDPSLNPQRSDGSVVSVSLADTLKAWSQVRSLAEYKTLKDGIEELKKCSYNDPKDQKAKETILSGFSHLQDFENKVSGSHVWKGNASLTVGATNTVTTTVTETYDGKMVKSPVSAKCDIKSSVLSLSAGPLFSSIPARDYVSVAVPSSGSSGQGTTVNELQVQDKSPLQPLLIGMLNYDLPFPYTNSNSFGLQVSSGPTFKIGGTNNVSSFGYFGGLSVHFWKRFFITPGVHVAEFADFPAGFSEGSTIPSGFGTLTPLKRWTARFGFSVSYRTNSISTIGQKNTSPNPTDAQSAKSAKTTPTSSSAGGSPVPKASTIPTPPSAGIAGSTGTGTTSPDRTTPPQQ